MATAVIGAAVSLFTGMQSLSAQKKAAKAAQKQQELADSRERRKLLRQSQIVQGQATNTAASIGGLGSSGLMGGLSNVTNQAQSQIGYQNQSSQLANLQSKYLQQANQWNMFGDVFSGFLKNSNFSLGGSTVASNANAYNPVTSN
jgi:hypothetical protein